MDYTPQPIDTSKVELTKQIRELTEKLSRHAHDVWAAQRYKDGWTLGQERNDALKKHPCLVPYEQLSETEKQYDRNASLETLKAVLALGYKIRPPSEGAPLDPATGRPVAELESLLQQLKDGQKIELASLLAHWRSREPSLWSQSLELYRQMAKRLLKMGEPLIAYDVTSEGLEYRKGDLPLRRSQGLALARCGAIHAAKGVLEKLISEGDQDEETLGVLARVYKDVWLQSGTDEDRATYLNAAFEKYNAAYKLTDGYWTGINAATLAAIRGERAMATALAQRVSQQCHEELARLGPEDSNRYWPLATLGEAALVLGNADEACRWYADAAKLAGKDYGNLNSTRRQALLLVKHLGGERAMIEQCLPMPRVVVFAGHMIDVPGRKPPRFPAEIEEQVRLAIRQRLQSLGPLIGYSSAACGSDIIFLEEVLEHGGTIHVILPYEREKFADESVDIIRGAGWRERYTNVLAQAAQITTVSPYKVPKGGVSYDYANQVLFGLSWLHADRLDSELSSLVVWDGLPGGGAGGTESSVERYLAKGLGVERLDLQTLEWHSLDAPLRNNNQTIAPPPHCQAAAAELGDTCVMGLLFADVKGFGALTEEQIPNFVERFLGAVAELCKTSSHAPVVKNTWGDALYLVFNTVCSAGSFALELLDRVREIKGPAHGLPEVLSLRIGLHAGPAYKCIDPVIDQLTYTGTHASCAARIEPITPPGQIYASEAFAALARVEQVTDFICEYVGRMTLPKDSGTLPLYHVRRRV
jgi:class 3 adenylate cyclase/tetratricopeptide (TPR) repeat protein